jgi:hypothetical protein
MRRGWARKDFLCVPRAVTEVRRAERSANRLGFGLELIEVIDFPIFASIGASQMIYQRTWRLLAPASARMPWASAAAPDRSHHPTPIRTTTKPSRRHRPPRLRSLRPVHQSPLLQPPQVVPDIPHVHPAQLNRQPLGRHRPAAACPHFEQ